jgi:hypothetical protein
VDPVAADRIRSQRDGLVDTCVEVVDLLGSVALADRLGGALEQAGVVAIDPSGETFDPGRHLAVHVVETDDASLDERIARVERVGYLDRSSPLGRTCSSSTSSVPAAAPRPRIGPTSSSTSSAWWIGPPASRPSSRVARSSGWPSVGLS